ncbi:MAG TPA: hypothetical protein VF092_24650 [Longimicrobium sp.]
MAPQPFAPAPMKPEVLKLLRHVMLTGILLFGGVAYWQSTHRAEPPDPEHLATLRWPGYLLCLLAIGGMMYFRRVRARTEPAARTTYSLIGTAMAEGAALYGAVYIFLGGDPSIFAFGVLIFLVTWAALPADPEAV